MSWSDFYLLCFLIGFSLSVISFLAGAMHLHLPFKWHLPFHAGHHGAGMAGPKGGMDLSWFNASTVLAFLAWFGGTGYILTTHSTLVAAACLAVAIIAGLFAGWIVFRFMAQLLKNSETPMNDWDYRHDGSIGKVSISIRPGGTGEVIFEQHGMRRSLGARSEDGTPIEKGAEVVISRYEKGIAYVKSWEEFTKV
jgi:membrane protein implicated in regulation of membrane protease activity